MQYDFQSIESRWQHYWAQHQTFRTPNPGDAGFDAAKPKYYVLDMFPYPSGVGLHVGHPLGYIATDIVARYRRMLGYNVLHPMGYDAFGLPAEQFAVEHGVHPRITTEKNINNMTRQLKLLGLSYDWDRSLATTDVGYYQWTQWIFLKLFNSWFDPKANKARPITELVTKLTDEEYYVDFDLEIVSSATTEGMDLIAGIPVGSRKWHELSQSERNQVLDNQRLAYLAQVPVNWCPALGTVLANEEVTADGKSDRGNHPVFKRPLKQWMLRITDYADRLIDELESVDWPEPIKLMQRNWIGKSTGAYVDFPLENPIAPASVHDADPCSDVITVFTTRPDTLFGATYMVLAPEHPLVPLITTVEQKSSVDAYQAAATAKTDVDRQSEAAKGKKSGVFTGAYAVNPVNGHKTPIWIADYVMMGYGTGAIMAVPAHDQRDFDFAAQFSLPMIAVVMPDDAWLTAHAPRESAGQLPENLRDLYAQSPILFTEAFGGVGTVINSSRGDFSLEQTTTDEAKKLITQWLEDQGTGKGATQYKLRDWLFSRQRYWGEPFPILHGPAGEIVALSEDDLPVELPEMEDFRPTSSNNPDAPPQPPLGRAPDSWKYVERDGVRYTRELNTMPQWAGSCWYYLRFIDPHDAESLVKAGAEKYWMTPGVGAPGTGARGDSLHGIDLYVGGAEHAVLHLLYARFWHKVLFDLGYVSTAEPFGKLFNQGYIQAYAYTDSRGMYVPADEVEEKEGKFSYKGEPVKQEFGKMGKSLKNSVAPDDVCTEYGCDTLRLYEMYMGPLDQSKVWNTRDIVGVHRFLQRVWRNFVNPDTGEFRVVEDTPSTDQQRLLHKTIKRVTEAMNTMSFNVAIAALIEFNNELVGGASLPRKIAEPFLLLLAPLAPHICEELWARLGNSRSLAYERYPAFDPALLVESTITYPIQVNGKMRGHLVAPVNADDAALQTMALADEKVQGFIAGKAVKKFIIVKGRMINIVVG